MKDKINNCFELTKDVLKDINGNAALEYALWIEKKAKIKFEKTIPQFPITNNFIYWCNLGVNIGSEQNKIRPAIVIRTQTNSTMCTILSLISERLNDKKWYHIDLECQNSTVMIEQLRNISKLRLLNPQRKNGRMNRITPNDVQKINKAQVNYYKLQDFPNDKY